MLVLCQISQNWTTLDLIGTSPARSSFDAVPIFLQYKVKTQNKEKQAIRAGTSVGNLAISTFLAVFTIPVVEFSRKFGASLFVCAFRAVSQ